MEETANRSTSLRPEGNRMLNAASVQIDLNDYIKQIKEEVTWEKGDRNSITLFKSENLRIVLIGLHKGAELKPHSTRALISVQNLKGAIKFLTNEEDFHLKEGQMIALQSDVQHHVIAIKESFFLLTLAFG